MKNLLKQFLDGKIGLDICSKRSAVFDMSNLIETCYPDMIVQQEPLFYNPREYIKTLIDYYDYCKGERWSVIVVDKVKHSFNAYRNSSVYLDYLKIYKAEEIMYDDEMKDVTETEIMNLFED